MAQNIKVRFAPSPTGKLHVGNIRTAVLTWLFARKMSGSFMLRLDDTDTERSTQEFANQIIEDMTWLGLTWDCFAKESDRSAQYDAAIEKLKQMGRVYACYETADELALKRKVMLGRGLPPIYDREALKLSEEQKKNFEDQGRKPHWRFKLNDGVISWIDLVRGPQNFKASDLSDPVLIREDGRPLYTITSVVDDVEFEISHIVRGEDHVTNTAVQIQLFEALGGRIPEFGHMPLIADKSGEGLSKRIGSLSMDQLRDEIGVEPLSIVAFLAKLGTSDSINIKNSIQELVDEFDFSKISRSTPKFDLDELIRFNSKYIHQLKFDDVKERLIKDGFSSITEEFWLGVRDNLTHVKDVEEWWLMAKKEIQPQIVDQNLLALGLENLPQAPWDEHTWDKWLSEIKQKTDKKGKDLFIPLRLALTGKEHGPELKKLLPLIGREKVVSRLQGKIA